MDEDLARERRASKKAPEDLSAALKLAARLERAGEIGEAWRTLERACHDAKGERREEASEALVALARKNPAALLAHFARTKEAELLGSLELLVERGEVVIAVVLACGPRSPMRERSAQRALREPIAKALLPPARSQKDRVPLPPVFKESLGALPFLPMHDDANPMNPWRVVEAARKQRLLALAPWLVAMSESDATALATDAKLCFEELTGQRDLPLDIEKLADRWRRVGR